MTALYDLLQGVNRGNQTADTALYGARPSGPQPQGSPQLIAKGLGDLKAVIASLNAIAETMRVSGLDKANEHVLDIIKCTKELQSIVVGVEKEQQAKAQQQAAQDAVQNIGQNMGFMGA